ncbi:hypothetical protein HanHA300_Chr04g0132221 [Helianthus annuus]|nr:hypothetical protein HanHA300_Chr04g0132221 [Helianthus annuus]KAJ0596641.1 hypothetical protein HanHA89_Chr04g0145191 [Helianthus annuus]KAJ0757308.1 hypothetical protein HanLR1_Chr04g0137191 [Helianthus annuus]
MFLAFEIDHSPTKSTSSAKIRWVIDDPPLGMDIPQMNPSSFALVTKDEKASIARIKMKVIGDHHA